MIRLIQRRLIIPRGDTGSFSIPVLKQPNAGDIAVFTIFDCSTRTRMFQKQVAAEGDTISIAFAHTDTVNLKPGKYFWDIKFYTNPVFVEDELVDGTEVDSYYAGYSLPDCEIRETADNYLIAPDGPNSYLTPEQLDIVTEAIAALQDAITKTETNVTHYPQIRDGVWYVWDAEVGDFVSTDSHTPTKVSELENDSGYLTTESDPTVPTWAKQATKPSYTASEVGALPADTYIPQKTSDLMNDSDFAVDANYVHTDNNYTTEEKTKLNSIAEGAEVNVNADWDATEGDAAILHKPTNVSAFENDAGYLTEHQDISGKADRSEIPTKVSQLQNDSGYLTTEIDPTVPAWAKAAQKPTYTAAEVGAPTVAQMEEAIANVNTMKIHICGQDEYDSETGMPTVANPDSQSFYLVPGGADSNLFIEWVYVNDAWERFGSADVDLSNYVQKTDYATTSNAGVVRVTGAGSGISIDQFGAIKIYPAQSGIIKIADNTNASKYQSITPATQHESVFYGLAKSASDTTQSQSDNPVGTYTAEAKTAIQTMLDVPAKSDIPDTSIYATKADTVLETTLSRGRKANTTVGEESFAFGLGVEASGKYSHAEGAYTVASGHGSHAEGAFSIASGAYSHAEGGAQIEARCNKAMGMSSHVEGARNIANGSYSHVEGYYNIGNASYAHIGGKHSVEDSHSSWPEWVASTSYEVGDKVKVTVTENNETTVSGYICQTANSDAEFTAANWTVNTSMNYAEIIGNGTANSARSNAYALDWEGNGHYMGDLYVHSNADSSGGTKVATVADIPNVPVTDVQVNSVSVLSEGVADIPIATTNILGVVKGYSSGGIRVLSDGRLTINSADESAIKGAGSSTLPIVPSRQHISVFYGLARAAGATMNALPNTTVGVYPDAQKAAIQQMLGVSDLIATAEPTLVASKAYAIGDVFTANGKLYKVTATIAANDTIVLQNEGETISGANAIEVKLGDYAVHDVLVNGTSIISNGIANIPVAGSSTFGVVKINTSQGILLDSVSQTLGIYAASESLCKAGTHAYRPIVPVIQHVATFYGLAKAAGDTTMSSSSNAVGTYTDSAKAAIKNMLGITQTLTVTALTQDNVTVTGQTVTVRADDATGEVYATAAYEGQPVSFSLPSGFQYYVSVSDNLDHHFNPTTAHGILTNTDVAVTLTYSDFSSIQTATDIKAALNADMDLTDLVGEQITCAKGSDTLTWDVVDYDATNKTIKLLLHDAFGTANMVFEPAQALMWCENGLTAGSYKFKQSNNTYYFTLTEPIPAGGQLRANTTNFWTYESQSATATIETGTTSTTEIADATDLGTTGTGLLNHHDRVNYGSNNYAESALYWWLNSDAPANTQRTPVTKFSRAYSYNVPGFLNGLDANFIAALDNAEWKCNTNNVYECPQSLGGVTKGKSQTYTLTAKIGLASEMEIFGSYGGTQDGSTVFDLYNGATATDRIKYRGTSAQTWWLRSPHWSYAFYGRRVTSSGIASYNHAYYSYSVVPAVQISKSN